MKTNARFVIVCSLFISILVFTTTIYAQEKHMKCVSIDLRSAPTGTKCLTSMNKLFERVHRNHFGEAWKDAQGMIWSDAVGISDFVSAGSICSEIGGTVPDKGTFQRAYNDGFKEVLPNINRVFWSSTVDPRWSYLGYIFIGKSGLIGYEFQNVSTNYDVRCVATSLDIEAPITENPAETLPFCNSAVLGNVQPGFKCRTSKNKIFERVTRNKFNSAWKDADGVIWSEMLRDQSGAIAYVDHKTANKMCRQINAKLPTTQNYIQGNSFGFHEVLLFLNRENSYFWSSTETEYKGQFFIYLGSFKQISWLKQNEEGFVICNAH